MGIPDTPTYFLSEGLRRSTGTVVRVQGERVFIESRERAPRSTLIMIDLLPAARHLPGERSASESDDENRADPGHEPTLLQSIESEERTSMMLLSDEREAAATQTT
jgi:hypothetical protein